MKKFFLKNFEDNKLGFYIGLAYGLIALVLAYFYFVDATSFPSSMSLRAIDNDCLLPTNADGTPCTPIEMRPKDLHWTDLVRLITKGGIPTLLIATPFILLAELLFPTYPYSEINNKIHWIFIGVGAIISVIFWCGIGILIEKLIKKILGENNKQ